jgi:hypothetical protein
MLPAYSLREEEPPVGTARVERQRTFGGQSRNHIVHRRNQGEQGRSQLRGVKLLFLRL